MQSAFNAECAYHLHSYSIAFLTNTQLKTAPLTDLSSSVSSTSLCALYVYFY